MKKNEKIFIIFIDKMIRACYIIYVNDELMVLLKIFFVQSDPCTMPIVACLVYSFLSRLGSGHGRSMSSFNTDQLRGEHASSYYQ